MKNVEKERFSEKFGAKPENEKRVLQAYERKYSSTLTGPESQAKTSANVKAF